MAGRPEPAPRRAGRILESRIARRILTLFVLATILPLLLFAGISLKEVSGQLERQAHDRLHETCKAVGMAVVERIHHLRADLALLLEGGRGEVLDLSDSMPGLGERLEERFEWLALVGSDGSVMAATGDAAELPIMSPQEREHFEAESAALLFRPTGDGETLSSLLVVGAHRGMEIDANVVGQLRPDYLWGGEWTQQEHTDHLALSEDGSGVLFASGEGSELSAQVRGAARDRSASGQFDYEGTGAAQLVSYRTMFTRPLFHSNFLIAMSQPRDYVLAPIATFKALFVLFGLLTLLAVVAASLAQIRRSLYPILVLQEGTQRLATDSSEEDVVLDSDDEFEELADAFNVMAHKVRERTKELQRANDAKSDFLAHMSHEIRTPLTAVLGYTEVSLAPEASESDRQRALEVVHENSAHLLDVVNSILGVSRIESGESFVERKPCRPATLVKRVVELLQVLAEKKGLQVKLEQDDRVPGLVVTDETRLRHILVNVLENAIKYTERGGIDVRSSFEGAEDGTDPRLVLEVRDTGPGIPRDQLEAIFEPFHQTDLSMSRRHGGVGLGLSLARGMARELGGDITCNSVLGVGSEFTITIDPGDWQDVEEPEERVEAAPDPERPEPSARRILVAEDVAMNRMLVVRILQRAGHTVDEAENGRIAFEKALAARESGAPYDLILMDMQMPEMDGYEATRRLREEGYDHPIVALTAHSMEGQRERCLDAGCDDYATKPIQAASLAEVVARCARSGSGSGRAA